MTDTSITAAKLEALAGYAALPLSDERLQAILPTLQAWVPAANALSARMSRDELRGLVPATILNVQARP